MSVVCGISSVHSKRPEVVTTALNLRLREQKVQKGSHERILEAKRVAWGTSGTCGAKT